MGRFPSLNHSRRYHLLTRNEEISLRPCSHTKEVAAHRSSVPGDGYLDTFRTSKSMKSEFNIRLLHHSIQYIHSILAQLKKIHIRAISLSISIVKEHVSSGFKAKLPTLTQQRDLNTESICGASIMVGSCFGTFQTTDQRWSLRYSSVPCRTC